MWLKGANHVSSLRASPIDGVPEPVDVPDVAGLPYFWSGGITNTVDNAIYSNTTSSLTTITTQLVYPIHTPLTVTNVCKCGHVASAHQIFESDWDGVLRESCIECFYDEHEWEPAKQPIVFKPLVA